MNRLTAEQFWRAIARSRMTSVPTIEACRRVLVEGATVYAAAKEAKRTQAVIGRAVAKLLPTDPPATDDRTPALIAALRKIEKLVQGYDGEPADTIRRTAKDAADAAEA